MVIFSDGASVIGTVPVAGGAASLTVAFPAAGVSHVIVALYVGSAEFASSDSTGDTVSVARATPTATLIVTPRFVRKKAKSVVLEVSVPAEFIGGPVPTGSITFDIGRRNSRTVKLVNGSASVAVAVGKVTGQSLIGRYVGDLNYAPVASSRGACHEEASQILAGVVRTGLGSRAGLVSASIDWVPGGIDQPAIRGVAAKHPREPRELAMCRESHAA